MTNFACQIDDSQLCIQDVVTFDVKATRSLEVGTTRKLSAVPENIGGTGLYVGPAEPQAVGLGFRAWG